MFLIGRRCVADRQKSSLVPNFLEMLQFANFVINSVALSLKAVANARNVFCRSSAIDFYVLPRTSLGAGFVVVADGLCQL